MTFKEWAISGVKHCSKLTSWPQISRVILFKGTLWVCPERTHVTSQMNYNVDALFYIEMVFPTDYLWKSAYARSLLARVP